jgi:hypothetical protein
LSSESYFIVPILSISQSFRSQLLTDVIGSEGASTKIQINLCIFK